MKTYIHQSKVADGVLFYYYDLDTPDPAKVEILFHSNDDLKNCKDDADPEIIQARDYTIKHLKPESSASTSF